jgi:hypothetical protein
MSVYCMNGVILMFSHNRNKFSVINWVLIFLIAIGIVASSLPSHAVEKEPTLEERIYSSLAEHSANSLKNTNTDQRYSSSNIKGTAQDNILIKKASTTKANKKNYIIFSITLAILLITLVNIYSVSGNSRYCTYCSYTGNMKLVALKSSSYENIILFIVRIFPVLQYLYSKRGRHICPRCKRTSYNQSLKSML